MVYKFNYEKTRWEKFQDGTLIEVLDDKQILSLILKAIKDETR